jgi:hypothetical protein
MGRGIDASTAAHAFAGPERIWISYATVDEDTPDQRSVMFSPEYGPLVNVTLRPHAVPVVCRVAHEVAGNGEGEWFPFVAQDEVLVAIPEGDEHAGCVIIGRLNQEIDAWPTMVAGQDATQNTFAFRRLRTPYILETASNYMIRDATTGAFISMNEGAISLSNADSAFLALNADFLGMQSADASTLIQINIANGQVVALANNGTMLVLDANTSSLVTQGTFSFATAGNQPVGHAVTLEGVVALLIELATPFAAAPITGSGLLAGLAAALTAMAASVAAAPPYLVGIQAALSNPQSGACGGLTFG